MGEHKLKDVTNEEPEEPQKEQEPEETLPAVIVYLEDEGGFNFSINSNVNPIQLAGIAWYLEQQAQIGLANLMMMQAQNKKPIFGPGGKRLT